MAPSVTNLFGQSDSQLAVLNRDILLFLYSSSASNQNVKIAIVDGKMHNS